MLIESEFHRVGAPIEKAQVPTFVLTLGTKSGLELDLDLTFLAPYGIWLQYTTTSKMGT